jgi:glucuronoarabinoxylan endo-1,4-beta-xylanase
MKNLIKAQIAVPLLVAAITLAIVLSTLTLTGCESPAANTDNPSGGDEQTANVYMTIPDPNLPANRFQYIRGYGGTDTMWYSPTTQDDIELMYNPDKLGYNILRIRIPPDNVDPAQSIAELVATSQPDYYENVKIVNKYGGYVMATPWTPPKDWKSNNSTNGQDIGWNNNSNTPIYRDGYLLPQYYPQYAQYLRDFARNMYDNGAPIYAISIQNEPNFAPSYEGCLWTPEQMRDFFIQQGRFTDGVCGWGDGKEIPTVMTMNGESADTPYINKVALQNPTSKAVIDLLGRHSYGKRTESLWNNYPDLLQKGSANDINKGRMEVWMTEHSINSGGLEPIGSDSSWNYMWLFLNDIDLAIRLNNENAFIWFTSKRFYSMIGDGQYGTTEGAILPRGWALSHYARFTIGMTRIQINLDTGKTNVTRDGTRIPHTGMGGSILNNSEFTPTNVSVRVTAFISENGNEISMVMWAPTNYSSGGYDPGVIEVALPPGFTANSVTAVRSNGALPDQAFQPYDVQLNQNRTKAYITLGKNEIVSVKFSK